MTVSLKKTLQIRLLVFMALLMLMLLVVLYYGIQRLVSDYVLTRLQHDAESIVSVIERDANGQWNIDPGHLSTVYNRVRSGHYYVVTVSDQELRSRSLFDLPSPVITAASGIRQDMIDGPGDERWLTYQQQYSLAQHTLNLWVAEDIRPVFSQINRYGLYVLLIIASAMLLIFFGYQKILTRSFEWFDRLSANLRRYRQRGDREPIIQAPVEVKPLIDEIDELVDQQQKRLERTRNAIANLAHEIKRPLQFLDINDSTDQSASARQQAIRQIQDIIERELKRARISGSTHSSGRFDLTDELPVLKDIMANIYPSIVIELECESELSQLPLDRVDMLELIGNLLDNACKFARAVVRFKAAIIDDRLQLEVMDDGDGVNQQDLARLTQRGTRLDESRGGYGLGLTICADIVDIYDGELHFESASMGGLRVRIVIPLK